jgi:hypothetical protein
VILVPHAQAAQRHARQEAAHSRALIEPFADYSALPHLGCTSGYLGFCLVGAPPQTHRLSPNRHRALELLAKSPDGATQELLVLLHGIDRDTIAGLVRAGLATARIETVNAGSKPIKVRHYRITNAGQLSRLRRPGQRIQAVILSLQ